MNIALFTDTFYPVFGGTETVVKTLAEEYLKLGHNVIVFTGDFGKRNVDNSQFPFKIVCSKSFYVGFGEFITYPNDELFTREIIDFKPDVIHAHTPFNVGMWGIQYGRTHKIKTVLTIHTRFNYSYELHVPFSKNNIIHKMVVRKLTLPIVKCVDTADIVTTVSKSSAYEEIKNIYGYKKDIKIIRNGFDYSNVIKENIDSSRMLDGGKLVLCFVGRIDKTKNIEFSLEVCKRLKDKNFPFEFHLYGGGKNTKKYETLVKKLCLSEKVNFLGKKNFKELKDAYSYSDALLFPSIFDNDSIVGIESRAFGCPTLAVKDTGTAERIQDGINGFVLDYSVEVFTKKIEELFSLKQNDISAYYKIREATKGMKVESWDVIAKEYINIYN